MAKEAITRTEAEERGLTSRPGSGFAREGYWDETMPSGLTRREEQRQKALEMHSEPHPDDPTRRRFGGAQPNSGPPRIKRMHEVLAETAVEEAQAAARALKGMLRHKSPMVQLAAIKQLLEIEVKNDSDMRDDERELRRMNGADLDAEFEQVMVTIGIPVRRDNGEQVTAEVIQDVDVVEDSDDGQD